ncbi:hypothetical protein SHL15_6754 [Streptomyces hygroscopicus subsp. limoneus]|nr:hypothetical protein SHL15_6754 [Streptomyces hygroscopicus subsp. limoneus]
MFSFLNEVFVGASGTMHLTESAKITITHADGTQETFTPDD